MDKLKEYFDAHRQEISEVEPPQGHEARFEAKLNRASGRRIRTFWAAVAACAAAAAIAVWGFSAASGTEFSGEEFLAATEDDPGAIYEAYCRESAAISLEIEIRDYSPGMENNIRSLSEEPVPLIGLLPDELSDHEKSEIMRKYYGALLDGLNELKESY